MGKLKSCAIRQDAAAAHCVASAFFVAASFDSGSIASSLSDAAQRIAALYQLATQ